MIQVKIVVTGSLVPTMPPHTITTTIIRVGRVARQPGVRMYAWLREWNHMSNLSFSPPPPPPPGVKSAPKEIHLHVKPKDRSGMAILISFEFPAWSLEANKLPLPYPAPVQIASLTPHSSVEGHIST